jgi:flagella basal body P-ring formation protein FlgA
MLVSTAAPAGLSRFLLKNSIVIPSEIKNSTVINGSDRIKIYSAVQKIPYAELARKATELLADSIVNNDDVKSEIHFEFMEGSELGVPLGEYEITLGKITSKQLRGRVVIPLIVVQKDGEKKTRVSLNAVIKVVAKICVAARDISRNDRFAPQFLEMKTVDISALQGTPLFEMPKLDEYMVTGVIRAGTVITDRHVAPKPVIEIGTPIKMTSGEGMVKVTIWGRARSAGKIGDIIAVENVESSKIVRGKIIQPGVVEIIRN